MATVEDPDYALSSSSGDEHARLLRQADWYAPYTRRLFAAAGIQPGMRVLDVGCGPGDVSFLAAELVGPQGSVVGVERDEAAVSNARQRAADRGVENVEFLVGDFREVDPGGEPFDALVGRLVLMYQADPAAAVASTARHLRAGGIVAFAEMCISHAGVDPSHALLCWPRTGAWQQLSTWIQAMHERLGTQGDMGYRLPETFAAAGLAPCTQLAGELVLAVGDEAVERIVDLTRSFLPMIVQTGAASEAEVGIDTLAERLLADTGPAGPVVSWPPVVGGFTTTSS
jgi:SAM-dependent methyltransferase